MRRPLHILVLSLLAASCATPAVQQTEGYVIRYINLEVVYEYALGKSEEAQKLKIKKQDLLAKIRTKESAPEYRPGDRSDPELEHYRTELNRLAEEEKKIKAAIYVRIRNAVEAVAKKYNVDFLLNTGEGVVYSRPVFDLTAEVVAELEKADKNSSPKWK